MEYAKAKSAYKSVLPRGARLRDRVLETAAIFANVVGGTLGPGGHPVLIERSEFGMPPTITKDGVTVFKALGFENSEQQCIMEAAREASVRTAAEAGDGTTTATILAEALVRNTDRFCAANPSIPTQFVIKKVQDAYKTILSPEIHRLSRKADLETEEGRRLLTNVARISANGDVELAEAVMKCFDITGDDGNVTIVETSGPTAYEVEEVKGYPIPMGFEESCGRFFPGFINRPDTQQCVLENPAFILYFGRINDIQTLLPLLSKLQEAWDGNYLKTHDVVVMATGFSETVLGQLMHNWMQPQSINVFPLAIPPSSQHNFARHFLDDMAAVTGATVLEPAPSDKTIDVAGFEDVGNIAMDDDEVWQPLGVTAAEVGRYRSTVIGYCQEDILLARVDIVRKMVDNAGSELDAIMTRERLAKLTGGIAKLKVVGSSNGENKERRDRADDAVCAVRGALKSGCLVGGGWTLARLASILDKTNAVHQQILVPSLLEPIRRLYTNAGISAVVDNQLPWWKPWWQARKTDDVTDQVAELMEQAQDGIPRVFNAADFAWTEDGWSSGLLDSTPAVDMALKNSISIATLLGTLGGTIVFPRDKAVDRKEAGENAEFLRNANVNAADERAM